MCGYGRWKLALLVSTLRHWCLTSRCPAFESNSQRCWAHRTRNDPSEEPFSFTSASALLSGPQYQPCLQLKNIDTFFLSQFATLLAFQTQWTQAIPVCRSTGTIAVPEKKKQDEPISGAFRWTFLNVWKNSRVFVHKGIYNISFGQHI